MREHKQEEEEEKREVVQISEAHISKTRGAGTVPLTAVRCAKGAGAEPQNDKRIGRRHVVQQ